MAVAKIQKHLEKMKDYDKDERFMATSDLTTELEGIEGIIDGSLQAPIRNAIIKQLEDSSTDVQSVAVKWYWTLTQTYHELHCLLPCSLAVLVKKMSAEQVVDIVDKLGTLVIDLEKKES